MKKVLGIILALALVVIPLGVYAQVEAGAGSITIGAHLDASFRYSAEDKDKEWNGYETFNGEALVLGLSGKVGDKVLWKTTWAFALPAYLNSGASGAAVNVGLNVAEAYGEWKILDQVGLCVGRMLVPTALANIGIPSVKANHMLNPPLIITGGFNGALPALPTFQTGAAIDVNFSGISFNYMIYNGELAGAGIFNAGSDAAQEMDKSKGGNVAIGYSGEIGPGKLTARAFYFQEYSNIDVNVFGGNTITEDSSITGWGIGVAYNADNYYGAVEYVNITRDPEDSGADSVNSYGYYVLVGGKFSSIDVAFRYDFIDWSDYDGDSNLNGIPDKEEDIESWYTLAINYLINDNATLGIDYVYKQPEEPDGADYPNINELAVYMELDLL